MLLIIFLKSIVIKVITMVNLKLYASDFVGILMSLNNLSRLTNSITPTTSSDIVKHIKDNYDKSTLLLNRKSYYEDNYLKEFYPFLSIDENSGFGNVLHIDIPETVHNSMISDFENGFFTATYCVNNNVKASLMLGNVGTIDDFKLSIANLLPDYNEERLMSLLYKQKNSIKYEKNYNKMYETYNDKNLYTYLRQENLKKIISDIKNEKPSLKNFKTLDKIANNEVFSKDYNYPQEKQSLMKLENVHYSYKVPNNFNKMFYEWIRKIKYE